MPPPHPALLRPSAALGALTLLAGALRLFRLGSRALWYDEAVLWWIASGSAGEVVGRNASANSAPPLHALLVHAAMQLNDGEIGLRALSALAGVAAVPAIYALARAFLTPRGALASALVTSVAPTLVFYSQQMREYSLTFLLATLMLGSFAWFMRDGCWRATAALTATWALGLGTQYGLALLALALNLVFLAAQAARWTKPHPPARPLARWAAAQLTLLGMVALVYQLALRQQMRTGGFAGDSYLAAYYWDGSLGALFRLIGHTWNLVPFAFEGWPLFLALLVPGVGRVLLRRQWTLAALCATPIAVTFLAALGQLYPYDAIRQTIFLTPMLYVVAGAGCEQLLALRVRPAFVGALCLALALIGSVGSVQYTLVDYENIRPLVVALPGLMQRGDGLYVHHGAAPAFRYYARSWSPNPAVYSAPDPPGQLRQADELLSRPGRTWLVFSHCNDAPGFRCQDLLEYLRPRRPLEQVLSDSQTYLVLVGR